MKLAKMSILKAFSSIVLLLIFSPVCAFEEDTGPAQNSKNDSVVQLNHKRRMYYVPDTIKKIRIALTWDSLRKVHDRDRINNDFDLSLYVIKKNRKIRRVFGATKYKVSRVVHYDDLEYTKKGYTLVQHSKDNIYGSKNEYGEIEYIEIDLEKILKKEPRVVNLAITLSSSQGASFDQIVGGKLRVSDISSQDSIQHLAEYKWPMPLSGGRALVLSYLKEYKENWVFESSGEVIHEIEEKSHIEPQDLKNIFLSRYNTKKVG